MPQPKRKQRQARVLLDALAVLDGVEQGAEADRARADVRGLAASMGMRIVTLTITDEPIPCAGMESMPGSDRDRIEAISREMFTRPGAHVVELEALSKKYPHVPMLRNHLAGAMEAAGRGEEARSVIERTAREFPTYVFAFCNHVMTLLSDGKIEEARRLVETSRRSPALTLLDFDPTRDTYHISEAVAHACMVGHYLLATGRRDGAEVQLEILKKTAPKSAAYRRLAAAMKQDPDKLALVAALETEGGSGASRGTEGRSASEDRESGGSVAEDGQGREPASPEGEDRSEARRGESDRAGGRARWPLRRLGRCRKDGTAMSVGGAAIRRD